MDHSLFMCGLEPFCNLPAYYQGFVNGERPFADPLLKRFTFDKLKVNNRFKAALMLMGQPN